MSEFPQQRRVRILEQVRLRGGMRVSELAQLLGVSAMTIRRDLDALARNGLVTKVHGGATRTGLGAAAPAPAWNLVSLLAVQDAIAARAALLVRPRTTIALTAGPTAGALARQLGGISQLTVVTNSIPVAGVLHENRQPDQTVIVTGGVRTPADALVGPVTVGTIRSLHVDMLFMDANGADAQAGLTTPDLMEAQTNRAFTERARHLVVLADHSKWGVVALSHVVALSEVGTFITDGGLGPEARSAIASQAGSLIVADAQPRTGP